MKVGQPIRFPAKIARSNIEISNDIGQSLSKLVYDVGLAELLPFNLLTAASPSSNPLWNARASSKGRSWRRLRMAPKLIGGCINFP